MSRDFYAGYKGIQGMPKTFYLEGQHLRTSSYSDMTDAEKALGKNVISSLAASDKGIDKTDVVKQITEPFRFLENFRSSFDVFSSSQSLQNVHDFRLTKGTLKAVIFERQK